LVKYSYAHKVEDVAYLNVIHNEIACDEGNGWIFSYTATYLIPITTMNRRVS